MQNAVTQNLPGAVVMDLSIHSHWDIDDRFLLHNLSRFQPGIESHLQVMKCSHNQLGMESKTQILLCCCILIDRPVAELMNM